MRRTFVIRSSSLARTRWAALLGAFAVLALAAPAAAQEPSPVEGENPYFETGAIPDSGRGIVAGYLSLGDAIPFVKLVTDSIVEQAGIAGMDLTVCDGQVLVEASVACGQTLGTRTPQGVINFNLFGDSSPEICQSYGNVPTVSIDIHQPPCETTFYGANNYHAGELAGIGVGEGLQAENGCTYDQIITLESQAAGIVNTDRVQGMLDGFASVCGTPEDAKVIHQEVGGTTQLALEKMNDLLATLRPGGITVILSLNDDMAIGAQAAMTGAGRTGELRIGAQGADPSGWPHLACDPEWLADTAYFPERYGRTVVPALIDILAGNPVAKTIYTPHVALTKANIRETYPETPACPA
jgi:ribose transport system substrate-binding protein